MHVVKHVRFRCKICDTEMTFDRDDPTSYQSKETHQEFFGMYLTTYRVSHVRSGERHVNVVLVDAAGFYRGHIDAYREPLPQDNVGVQSLPFHLLSERPVRESHSVFRVLFMMHLQQSWVLDLVMPSNLDVLSLARIVQRHVHEAQVVYKTIPEQIRISVADFVLHLWINDQMVLAAALSPTSHLSTEFIDFLFQHVIILHQKLDQLSGNRPIRDSFEALLSILQCPRLQRSDVEKLTRILTDHLFHAQVELRYKEHWPLIKKRLVREFSNLEEFFETLLKNRTSIMELLKDDRFACSFREIVEAVDFINRRHLFDIVQK